MSAIYFIGAGPGEPGLLTLRGAELLARATHVVAEPGVHEEVLAHAKDATRTSEDPVELARKGARVARVFSGDPTLLHGEREIARAVEAKIAIEIVPGVSPLEALGAFALPLSRAADGSPSVAFAMVREVAELHDWSKLADATDAIVIQTDAAHVPEIEATLAYHGRSLETPAALVRDLGRPTQSVNFGALRDMPKHARELRGEVLFAVGAPLALRDAVRWFDRRPLAGKRILVLRARDQSSDAARLLRARGAEPLVVPAIEVHPPEDRAPLDRAARELDRYGVIAFSSANAVRAFFEALDRAGLDARAIRGKIAAIGPQTASALAPLRPDIAPGEAVGEALADAIASAIPSGARVLIPRARQAREALPEILRARGHEVDVVVAYENRPAPEGPIQAAAKGADAALLTSSSIATRLFEAVGAPPELAVASIGPITTETAEKLGFRVAVTAEPHTLEGLVLALEGYFAGKSPGKVG